MMKHYTSLLLILIGLFAVLAVGTNAVKPFSQPLGVQSPEPERGTYISESSQHRLIFRKGSGAETFDESAYRALADRGAIVQEIDYGSFKLVIADEQMMGGRDQLLALGAALRDDMDLISINGYVLNARNPEAIVDRLPYHMRMTDGVEAVARGGKARAGLYIVQFIGPVKDEWLEQLKTAGAEIVSYLGSNAYVVSTDEASATQMVKLGTQEPHVQFVGDYHPAYRLSSALRTLTQSPDGGAIDIVARVIDAPGAQSAVEYLSSAGERISPDRARGSFGEPYVKYFGLKADATQLEDIARMDSVLAVDQARIESSPDGDQSVYRQVRKQFRKLGQPAPSPAMVKAYLANIGDGRSLQEHPNSPFVFRDRSQTLSQTGQTFELNGTVVSSAEPLRVALAWSDASSGRLDRETRVNDLDLEVTINGITYKGNVFSDARSVPGGEADSRADIESVLIPAGVSGDFKIVVRASNIAGDGVPGNADRTDQDFALVVSNADATPLAVTNPSIFVSPFSLFLSVPYGTTFTSTSLTVNSNDSWHLDTIFLPFWVNVFPTSGGSGFSFVTVQIFPSGLCPGTHTTNLTFRTTSCCASSSSFLNLTVTGAIPCTSPTSLTFNSSNGSNPPPQSLSISNCGSGTLNWTATDNASWLSVSPTSGTAPSTLTVSVNAAGLANGTYTGQITISTPTGCPRTIPVTFNLSRPTIVTNPTSLSFSAVQSGPNPPNKTVAITTPVGVLNWTATDNASWLSVSPTSGTAPSTLTVSVNKSGLAVGTYNANITITSPNAGNSPKTVPVTLTVTNSATMTLSPTSLNFFKNIARPGSVAPKTFTISVSAGSANWTVSDNASWLSVSPASGTATSSTPSTVTVSVNIGGLGVGTYNATITVNASGVSNSPQTIPVTLNLVEIEIEPPPPHVP